MATSKMSTQPCQKFGEDLINCTICFDNFKDAKVLPCLHSFCQSCITRHYEVYRLKNGNRLSCPTCRELLPVPGKGVAGLRNDNTIIKTKELLDQVNCLFILYLICEQPNLFAQKRLNGAIKYILCE